MVTRSPAVVALVTGLLAMVSAPLANASCIDAKSGTAAHQIYGQLVMVGFTGLEASDDGVKEALRDIEEGYAGGLVFFGRNILDAEQIRKLTGLLKSEAALYPPLLAIDEEGGQVERLTPQNGFQRQPSAATIAARGAKVARDIYAQMAGEIADAGFNFNLGPVVDLNLHRTNPVIGSLERSYGSDPQTVVEYAQAFVEAHRQQGVATALKHYPGHGSSRQDSHISIVDVTDDWKVEELVPYRELIRDRLADAVMITHLINRNFWSANNLPATLSGNAISYLRQDLGFDGVVLSDDLQMAAVARDHPLASAIVSALAAGNDIVLVGNVLARQPKVARFAVTSITEAVAAGELDQDRLEQAFCRVIALKQKLARQNGDSE